MESILAASAAVAPVSYDGFSSTMSPPATRMPSDARALAIPNSSRGVIPSASGFPTPGANAGSSTSRSKLTYTESNEDAKSRSVLGAPPSRTSESDMVLMPLSLRYASSSAAKALAPMWSMQSVPRSSAMRRRYVAWLSLTSPYSSRRS